MTDKEFNELIDITEKLEDKARHARAVGKGLFASLYECWIDNIKNCEVSVEEARQMLHAANI